MIAYLECFKAKKFKVWAGLDTHRDNPDGLRIEIETFDRLVLKLSRDQVSYLAAELIKAAEIHPVDPNIPREPWETRPNYEPGRVRGNAPRISDVEKGQEEWEP